jgi:hypothetical protein
MDPNDVNDPDNPLNSMMPPADNPEYHRRLAEHKNKLRSDAEAAVMSDPAHAALGDRITGVRQTVPQAATPVPLAQPQSEAVPLASGEHTGLTVDPTQAQVPYTPVEPRMPAGAVPAVPPAPVPVPAVTDTSNPILLKLREDFGIDNIPLEDVDINGHLFTMRVLDTGSITRALRFADTLSMPGSERENGINLQIAMCSFAVLAIDGEPVWQVFNVPIPKEHSVTVEGTERPIFAPMDPPTEVRIVGATQLMDFISGQASTSLLNELWKQYREKIDPKGTLDELMLAIQEGEEPDVPLP